MNKNNNPKELFWKLLGQKAAKEGIELGNPEEEIGKIPFVPGIVNAFFKGWREIKESQIKYSDLDS